jgi:hypothetical protein
MSLQNSGLLKKKMTNFVKEREMSEAAQKKELLVYHSESNRVSG